MKKIISLLLALLVAFSVVTVAFAESESTATEPESSVTDENQGTVSDDLADQLGDFGWILDLPFWTVGPAFKFAKIAFKLVSAYLKVAKIFGIVDQDMEDMILNAILSLIEGGDVELPELGDIIPGLPEADEDVTDVTGAVEDPTETPVLAIAA